MKKIFINPQWKKFLKEHLEEKSFQNLLSFIEKEYENKKIYPGKEQLFYALNTVLPEKVRVVILGQDPYHNPNQAHGLAFSVPKGISLPPSLKNIYKEIESDLNIEKDFTNGNLESWTSQGVLLLNSILTVEENKPGIHKNKGWEKFTDFLIEKLSKEKEHLVFILWGNYAKDKGKHIDRKKHLVLESNHPSPLSAYRGFFGNKHFSQTNNYLKKYHNTKISW